MKLRVTIMPGGETRVRTEDANATVEDGTQAILRLLRTLSEKGRIPFASVAPIESHRHGGHEEHSAYRQSEHEGT